MSFNDIMHYRSVCKQCGLNRNPPKFIMSISIIMSLIMTLLVFQCRTWKINVLSTRYRASHGCPRGTWKINVLSTRYPCESRMPMRDMEDKRAQHEIPVRVTDAHAGHGR